MIKLEKIKEKLKIHKGKNKQPLKRSLGDLSINLSTIVFAFFTIGMLIWMLVYIISNGSKVLSWDYLTGDYKAETQTIKTKDDFTIGDLIFENKEDNQNFSNKRGVSLLDGTVNEEKVVFLISIDENSPFHSLVNSKNEEIKVNTEYYVTSLAGFDKSGNLISTSARDGANEMAKKLDEMVNIIDGTMTSSGGGIRGSLLTTLALIGFSLLFALPLGVGGAIYLAVYAKDGPITHAIRTLIDVTSGIPSIIFGLAGAIIFIPFTNVFTGTNGGNMFSGALTMAIMLLPTIVKTTEESIRVIPRSMSQASLALGASQTQTVFKVVIPNALPGILTSTLLSIGRIIGESAALVFAMGTTIGEGINLGGGNATLAVHIWYILQGETPKYASACAISIIILIVVLILSCSVKLISLRLNKFKGALQ